MVIESKAINRIAAKNVTNLIQNCFVKSCFKTLIEKLYIHYN